MISDEDLVLYTLLGSGPDETVAIRTYALGKVVEYVAQTPQVAVDRELEILLALGVYLEAHKKGEVKLDPVAFMLLAAGASPNLHLIGTNISRAIGILEQQTQEFSAESSEQQLIISSLEQIETEIGKWRKIAQRPAPEHSFESSLEKLEVLLGNGEETKETVANLRVHLELQTYGILVNAVKR